MNENQKAISSGHILHQGWYYFNINVEDDNTRSNYTVRYAFTVHNNTLRSILVNLSLKKNRVLQS